MINLKAKISNWNRFQSILSILAKHGFAGFLKEFGFTLPRGSRDSAKSSRGGPVPVQLRLAFEELGPTFIKLGQILSTRTDLLPEEYTAEFSKLTNRIPRFPFSSVLEILQAELGRDPYEIFESIEEEPLAAASISQVHRAKVKDTGKAVVIKVQRPNILTTIQGDIQVLHVIAASLEKVREDFRLMNLSAIVKEFQRTIYEELDFTLEARNIGQFSENLPQFEGIVIPEVLWSCTTSRVLTMNEVKGVALSHLQDFPENVDRPFLAQAIVSFFFESMFFHGLFHADAHPGNVLLIPEGRGTLALLDFGMVGTLSSSLRTKLSQLFLAIVSKDFETLASVYVDIGEFQKKVSIRDFQSDVALLLSPHLGKPIRQVNVGQLLLDSTKIARKHRIRLPRDLIMFYRSLVTLEFIGRKLDPDFDFLTYGQKFGQTLVKRRLSTQELLRDFFKALEGIRALGTELPTQIKTLMRKIEAGEMGSSMDSSAETLTEARKSHRLMLVGFLNFTLIFCATFASVARPYSPIELPLWIAALSTSILFLGFLFRRK